VPRGILLSVAVLVVGLSSCKRSPPEPPKEAPAGAASNSRASLVDDDDDARAIEQLRASGSDLSRPIVVDQYLYFPNEEVANSVAEAMRRDGYSVEIEAPGSGVKNWACIAKKPLMVTPSGLREVRGKLTVLAEQAGGEYDGWEASVTR
jgi:hypothetical protein